MLSESEVRSEIGRILQRYGEVGAKAEILALEREKGFVVVLDWTDGSTIDDEMQLQLQREIEEVPGVEMVTIGLENRSDA